MEAALLLRRTAARNSFAGERRREDFAIVDSGPGGALWGKLGGSVACAPVGWWETPLNRQQCRGSAHFDMRRPCATGREGVGHEAVDIELNTPCWWVCYGDGAWALSVTGCDLRRDRMVWSLEMRLAVNNPISGKRTTARRGRII